MAEKGRLRVRIIWVLLGAFSGVAVLPLVLSHLRLAALNREALGTVEEQVLLRSAVKVAGDADAYFSRAGIHLRRIADGLMLAQAIAPDADPFSFVGRSALLRDYAVEAEGFLVLRTVDREGRGGRAEPEGLEPAVEAELRRTWETVLKGKARGTVVGQPVRGPRFPDGGIVLAVPVASREGRVLGAVQAFVSLEKVKRLLEDERKREVVAYVVDRQGRLVIAADPELIATSESLPKVELVREFISHPVRLTKSYTHGEGSGARKVLGTVAPMELIDWGVLVEKDEEKAYALVSRMIRATWDGAAFAFLLAVGVAVVAARLLSKPVVELLESVRLVADGQYAQRVPIRGARELAELSETFNVMSEAIEKSVGQLKQAAKENQELFFNSIRALTAAIDAKDPYTRGHSERVARYAVVLAKNMGLPPEEVRKVRISALLHDVGKIGIDDRILRKPTALTDEEFEVMKTHPVKGALIMGQIPQLKEVIPGMRHHHEKWTGDGYPDGLTGEEIPMLARIIAVADTFDAMTTTRPYQKAMRLDFVVGRIRSFSGVRFDPDVIKALDRAFTTHELEVVGEAARLAVSA
jgi:HD-GYP domain-containing protein (c-di-GMP phosphodiesterase class II)